MNEETYQDELAALAADEATFVRLTMSGVVRDPSVPCCHQYLNGKI